jgi:hypothetical protein
MPHHAAACSRKCTPNRGIIGSAHKGRLNLAFMFSAPSSMNTVTPAETSLKACQSPVCIVDFPKSFAHGTIAQIGRGLDWG